VPETKSIDVLVLVKASPVMTSELDETMCVAGVRIDSAHNEWARLHPVPFRDLTDDSKFAKYQIVNVTAIRHHTDRRPESWTPLHGSIVPGDSIGPQHQWASRRPFIEGLGEELMCELVERNRAGSGPGVPSLAVVRPVEPPKLIISERKEEQVRKWQLRATAAADRPSLFDDPNAVKPPFEVVPWRFSYRYHCKATACSGHNQTIVDWEAASLWRHVRHHADWKEAMKEKFESQMWAGRDSVLFVGNMEQYPVSFLVLGVFWPPAGAVQGVLGL
jgi:hypothetical protein